MAMISDERAAKIRTLAERTHIYRVRRDQLREMNVPTNSDDAKKAYADLKVVEAEFNQVEFELSRLLQPVE